MRRVARFLIRLYPASWRERYGEEFEVLLEDSSASSSSVFDLLKGAVKMQFNVPAFPNLALLLSIPGLLAGLGISFLVTPIYESNAVVAFDEKQGTAVVPEVVAAENDVMSRGSLSGIIADPRLNLYAQERRKFPTEDVIERMRRHDIHIERQPGSDSHYVSLAISFSYSDAYKAQMTTQALVSHLMDAYMTQQRHAAILIRQSPDDEIERLRGRVAFLEKELDLPSTLVSRESPAVQQGVAPEVLEPPSLPEAQIYPNRTQFAGTGFGSGFLAAILIAIFRRRPPPLPFPAQTA